MNTPGTATLEWLFRPPSSDTGIDRKALAGLLAELARSADPEYCADTIGVAPVDPRLRQLRTLLLGREIEILSRLKELVEDPEQLAIAVGRVLPTAIAHATSDARLGQVLAPALEKAAQSSIRSDPRTLVNILHPLVVPAIRQSIGEAIDQTFQSLNESLKHSLTWRGLRWRYEAWRTGTSFAEVVLKHTLVYQIEHAFLIHNHTGLLISHVAAEDAVSQDPQLVSSMLVAIQDFVQDSFGNAGQQGLDSLRLGELRLWSERGSFATLVAVIRGNPPEELHESLRDVLSQIHAARPQALENFAGDSAGFADVEAQLTACTALRQRATKATRTGFPWLVALIGLVLLALAGAGGFRWWQNERLWESKQRLWTDYIARLRDQPGIVITEVERRGDKFLVAGLRDPLAVDPQLMLRQAGIDPARVVSRWVPYQGLDPEFVLKRLQASLDPPPGVTLSLLGDHIVAQGSAPFAWLERARAAGRMLPAGGPGLDLSGVQNADEGTNAKLREAMQSLREAIQSHEIHFDTNEPLPAPGQDTILDELAQELKQLSSLSSTSHVPARVALTGHSDDTGRGTFNLSLSLARSGAVLTLLKKRGVDPDLLALRGSGPLDPLDAGTSDVARASNRRVSFTVGIGEQP
jgi:outer membrane protein OmpA-like peptidoglycan-associated protein